MHTRMAWLALFLATGCASTRTRVMDASEAAALGPRAHVVALKGEDAYGTIGKTDGGLALITANGRAIARVAPRDTVRVEVDPNDPVERPAAPRAQSDGLTKAGMATLVPGLFVGAIGFIGTATVHYSPPAPCGLCINLSIDPRPIFWTMAAIGATASVIGAVLLVADAASRPRAARVAVAPIVAPNVGGGSVVVTF